MDQPDDFHERKLRCPQPKRWVDLDDELPFDREEWKTFPLGEPRSKAHFVRPLDLLGPQIRKQFDIRRELDAGQSRQSIVPYPERAHIDPCYHQSSGTPGMN